MRLPRCLSYDDPSALDAVVHRLLGATLILFSFVFSPR